MILLVSGAAVTITGRLASSTVALACGATGLSLAVGWLYVELRRDRRSALPARFTFIPRAYERACGAFLWGALLGLLLGAGTFSGTWYGAARAAHLQLMLLGWAGITLLATMVMFGPAVMRARIRPRADARAARMLPHAVTALTVAGFALLATGAGGFAGTGARVIATAALVVYAASVIAVCVPVIRTSVHAPPTAARSFVVAASMWFIVAVVVDVVSVAGANPLLTDVAAVALLFGVLLNAILASITHVLPLLIGHDAADKARIGLQIGALHRPRAAILSAGTLLVVGGMTITPDSASAQTGWVLIAVVMIITAALASAAVVGARHRQSP